MPYRPLRLLHTAQLRLDEPLRAARHWPEALRSLARDATLQAWDTIIHAAIDRDVDAVLVCGDSFRFEGGSLRGEVAFRQGVLDLGEQGIPVCVTPGLMDPPAAWNGAEWPDNLHLLRSCNEEGVELSADGETYACILPVSQFAGVAPPELDLLLNPTARASRSVFTVGLYCPYLDGQDLRHEANRRRASQDRRFASLQYLACGGVADDAWLPLTEGERHASGPPQSLGPDECGSRAATLVEVSADGRLTLLPIATSVVRYEQPTFEMTRCRTTDELLEQIAEQHTATMKPGAEKLLSVRWRLVGTGPLRQQLLEAPSLHKLSQQLTGLLDSPKGARSVHELLPWEPAASDADEDDPGSLLNAYLTKASRRLEDALTDPVVLWGLLAAEGRDDTGAVPEWLAGMDPQEIAHRVRRLGREWLGERRTA